MSIDSHFSRTLLLATGLVVAGCSSEPMGQVVATIDGKEVTRRELQAELDAEGSAFTADPRTRAAALEGVIDRKLLAEAARRALVDRMPTFQAAVLRDRERLLAQSLLARGAESLPATTAADISARIAAQPWRYGERTALLIERSDADGRPTMVDSATLSRSVAQTLISARIGTPIRIDDGPAVVVRQRWPIALNADQQTRQAAADLRREKLVDLEQRLVAGLRAQARIERQGTAKGGD